MTDLTRICPMCAEEIPATARVCPHCRTPFEVRIVGYCPTDHEVVEADEDHKCRRCGSAVLDVRVETRMLEPRPIVPGPAAAEPSITGAPGSSGPGGRPVGEASSHPARPGSYIDRHLLPAERILFRTRMHWARAVRALLWIVLGVFFYVIARLSSAVITQGLNDIARRTGLDLTGFSANFWRAIPLLLLAVALIEVLSAVGELVGLIGSELAITDQRILGNLPRSLLRGLFLRKIDLPLNEIAQVKGSRAFLTPFNYGNVRLSKTDRRRLTLRDIPRPDEFQRQVELMLAPS